MNNAVKILSDIVRELEDRASNRRDLVDEILRNGGNADFVRGSLRGVELSLLIVKEKIYHMSGKDQP